MAWIHSWSGELGLRILSCHPTSGGLTVYSRSPDGRFHVHTISLETGGSFVTSVHSTGDILGGSNAQPRGRASKPVNLGQTAQM
jgi:hypothetical protein